MRVVPLVIAASALAGGAQAAVTISLQATQNVNCSNGTCTPTAKQAVLNAGDLETLLASGNVVITTTGQGVQAKDIDVKAAVAWSSGSALTLDAWKSITIYQPVVVSGTAALALTTNDGGSAGTLSFGKNGNVSFASLSSQLTINGAAYTLVGDLKTLANDIVFNPSGDFALANSYDASADGTYTAPPIRVTYTGSFDGLGNAISNFALDYNAAFKSGDVGLFAEVGTNGAVQNLGLVNAKITCTQKRDELTLVGSVIGENHGAVLFSFATGRISDHKLSPVLGGLVGRNYGVIMHSHASVAVSGPNGVNGGLVGENFGAVDNSFASGAVSGVEVGGFAGTNDGSVSASYATGDVQVTNSQGIASLGGGLIGDAASGAITNSYATGAVSAATGSSVGGLVGVNDNLISFSYSTGAVRGGAGDYIGGLTGYDGAESGSLTDTYWNTDTSGITDPSQGAGNIPNDPGITGLTTTQFQSGLPAGFDQAVWTENSHINSGLPYLFSNPPRRNK